MSDSNYSQLYSINNNGSEKNSIKKSKKPKKLIYSIIFISILIIIFIFCYILFYKRKNRKNNNQLERFYNSIPASLKSDSFGNFNLDKSGFNAISNSNKHYKPENFMILFKTFSKQISKMNGNMDTSILLDATIYHNDFNFKTEINEIISESYESESYSFIAKIKIGSISILSNMINLTESFKDKIKTIANENSYTNEEKAKSLDDLINLHGYYIPLKINFGGLFMIDSQDFKNNKSEEYIKKLNGSTGLNLMNINLDIKTNYGNEVNKILNEFYSNSKKIIIGGDLKKNNFEDWKLSINKKNSEIINYDNIIKITDLLDEDIKIKLKVPLKIIDEKYKKRKNYYETVNKLKQIKKSGKIKKSGNGKYELGFDNNYNNLIYNKTRKINKEWELGTFTVNEKIAANDIIVGIKIIPEKNNDGKWEIKGNPLLSYEMSIKISSGKFRGIKYNIIVYMMKLPD